MSIHVVRDKDEEIEYVEKEGVFYVYLLHPGVLVFRYSSVLSFIIFFGIGNVLSS